MNKEKFLENLNSLSADHKPALLTSAVVTMIIMIVCIILYSFFPQKIAQARFQQIELLGETTSTITSKLALSSMYRRNKTLLAEGLDELSIQIKEKNSGLMQISVILYPTGIYYASTSIDFIDKKIHPSLREKIENSNDQEITINALNYQDMGKTIPVLQFLRNILVEREGKKIRIATTQILFNYSYIVEETKSLILLMGAIIFLVSQFLIWFLLLPRSYADVEMLRALRQARMNNYGIKFQANQWGLNKKVIKAYYSLMRYLKLNPPFVNTGDNKSSSFSLKGGGSTSERTFRKTSITTLCSRIPNIQKKIDTAESTIPDFLKEHLEVLQKVIKKNGGKISSIFGDKIFVLFEGVNGTDNSLRAATEINNQWKKLNHEKKVLKQEQLTYGIGIHEAQSIAGTFIDLQSNYTYISESAGFASYLCDCSNNEEILISTKIIETTNLSIKQKRKTDSKAYWLSNGEEIHSLVDKDFTSIEDSSKKSLHNKHASQTIPPNPSKIQLEQESELSIPNMLEETMSQTPLETVKNIPSQQENALQDIDLSTETEAIIDQESPQDQDLLEESSMWGEFKTSKSED